MKEGELMRDWLTAIRELKGLSQKYVAERVGIKQPTYSNIENGNRRPSVEVAKQIADVLGFEWTRFFEDKKESEKGA